ncbi:MAG TPA: EamA family transporter [Cytophagaceae bacterium]
MENNKAEQISLAQSEEKKTSQLLILLAFAAVYIIWGSTYLGIKFAIETFPPFLMAGIRFVVAGVLLYALGRFRGAERPAIRYWKSSAYLGLLLLVLGNGGLVWAEQRVPSGIAALLITVEPIWVVLLQWVRKDGSKPNSVIWISFAMAFAGMMMLVGPGNLGGISQVDPLGFVVIMISTLGWAAGSLMAANAETPKSPMITTGMQMISGGALLMLVATFAGEWQSFNIEAISDKSLWAFLYLIVFGSIIGYSAYTYLTRVVTPTKVSTYAYVNPIVAVFLGAYIGGEEITLQTILAAGFLIVAVALIILKNK